MRKKLHLLLLGLVALAMPMASNAQILFQEDFDGISGPTSGGPGTYNFPAGWLKRNVDNFTPATTVNYVNEAWERREDFAGSVSDSAAFSTSWYTPAGTANDWMWTPVIGPLPANSTLYWNAITYDPSYPDGYEVRVMPATSGPPTGGTGTIGNQITASTTVFSIPAENTTWTARTASLSAYSGQSVYIGFRNNSTDQFLLLIDDVRVEAPVSNNALMASADTLEYTIVPEAHQPTSPFSGSITNFGSSPLSNVQMQVIIRNSGGATVYNALSTAQPSLAAGATANFTVPATTLTPEFYTIAYVAKHSAADADPLNDTLYNSVLVDASVYARDDASVTGALGIGAGNGGYLGQTYEIMVNDVIDTVMIYVTGGYTGEPLSALIYNTAAGTPNTIIGSTDTIMYPDDSARVYFLPVHGGGVGVTPGQYVIAVEEYDSTLNLAQTNEIFTNGKTWVVWPTSPFGGWANNEDFGSQFAKPYVIRPFLNGCANYAISTSATDACSGNTGSATATIGGVAASNLTYNWSNGGTTSTITNLAAGTYNVTVTAFGTCQVTGSVTVNNNAGAAPSVTLTTTNAQCFGNNGTIAANVTGGTPNYTYSWSNGANTASITAAAGTYNLTVTDAAGCSALSSSTITQPAVLALGVTNTPESSAGANDGTATANVSGGTAPYTYAWSDGQTTQTAVNLGSGAYSVTITDANGCTQNGSTSVVVGVDNGIADPVSFGAFPNPNDGTFWIFINSVEPTEVSVKIMDLVGKVVYEESAINSTGFKRQIDLRNESAGMYLIQMSAGDSQITRKIEVKH